MAFGNIHLQGLLVALQHMPPNSKVLSLGYPDLLLTERDVMTAFPSIPNLFKNCAKRDDADFLATVHGNVIHDKLGGIVLESYDFFERLGLNLEVWDIESLREKEIIMDLNTPIPLKWHEQYDLIIDPGTLEHCFNVCQVMFNITNAVKPNGLVLHVVPFLMYNHGFFNFSPKFFALYYTHNQFQIISQEVLKRGTNSRLNVDMVNRVPNIPPGEYTHRVLVQRTNNTSPRIPLDHHGMR